MIAGGGDIYRARRQEVEAAHLAGAGGVEVCLRHSLLVDQLVRSVLGAAGGSSRIAVVAVGGYGRQELCLASDIDLLFLVPRLNEETAALSKHLFYGLLGLGLAVSHSVRTGAECLRMVQDIQTLAALLDSRLVAGEAALFRDMEWRLRGWLARHGSEAAQKICQAVEARHARYGGANYLFEPNVKEGPGGLRDAQALLWAARGVGLAPASVSDLASQGLLDPEEAEVLKGSVDFLLRVRNHLHLTAGKKCDRLLFAQQSELAAFFGRGDDGAGPVEAFMRDYHRHAARLAYVCRTALSRLLRSAEPGAREPEALPEAAGNALGLEGAGGGELLMGIFAEAARRDGELQPGAARLVRKNLSLVDEEFRRSPQVAGRFLDLLCSPAAPRALEHMLHLGLLEAYIPEFAPIRHLVQHDGYHVSTADLHSVATLGELARLRSGDYEAEEPVLTALARQVERQRLLCLAALLHDIGKGSEAPHAARGAELALAIGERLGLPGQDARDLSRLVEHHLLLSEAAQRSDLGDEDLLRRLARQIDPDLLRMLYVLTFADSKATGPSSWTTWKSALIRELFFKLLSVLEHQGAEAAPPETITGDIAARLGGELSPERVAWHLSQMPAEYLSAVDAETACEHILLVEDLLGGHKPLTWALRQEAAALSSLSLCAPDRPGLLAKAAGLFALHGLSIHEARLYTRHDAVAVDTFRLSPVLPGAPATDWQKVTADLAAGLSGRMSLPYRLARKLRPSPLERDDLPGVATEVSVNNQLSSLNTVIEVRTRDRLGLLYLLARALFELELNICLARVTTKGHQACDVFFVRDFSGNKVYEPGHVEEIEQAIRFALEG